MLSQFAILPLFVFISPSAADVSLVEPYKTNAQYSYGYRVHDPVTGDSKTQEETRDGDVVRGSYSLVEPDGTLRIVRYTADSVNGFNAVVERTNSHLPVAPPLEPVALSKTSVPVVTETPVLKISPNPAVRIIPSPALETLPPHGFYPRDYHNPYQRYTFPDVYRFSPSYYQPYQPYQYTQHVNPYPYLNSQYFFR